jgi:glycosyltransferase involved in cell wall biosynthesis
MPVYNGENYLAAALDSILAQTFTDFELIISDNASDDRTEAICRAYAARDSRIQYIRQAENRGAAANYNLVLDIASGEYFKWAAHDDLIAPAFLAKCVEVLDSDPEVVLCHSRVQYVDSNGCNIGSYDPGVLGTDARRPSDRFGGRISTSLCKEVFGLIRTEPLRGTVLTGNYVAADQALLAELSLCGRFHIIPEPLFMNREHRLRSVRTQPYRRLEWFTAQPNESTRFFRWKLFRTFCSLVGKRVPDLSERLRCYGQLFRVYVLQGRAILLLLEPLFVLRPNLYNSFRKGVQLFRANAGLNGEIAASTGTPAGDSHRHGAA